MLGEVLQLRVTHESFCMGWHLRCGNFSHRKEPELCWVSAGTRVCTGTRADRKHSVAGNCVETQ